VSTMRVRRAKLELGDSRPFQTSWEFVYLGSNRDLVVWMGARGLKWLLRRNMRCADDKVSAHT
jgi:hypothetical protein